MGNYNNLSVIQLAHMALEIAIPYMESVHRSRTFLPGYPDYDQGQIDIVLEAIARIEKVWADNPRLVEK